MKQLYTDITETINIIDFGGPRFYDEYCKVALFSNERLTDRNGIVSCANKSILTPLSSGDQFLGAVYGNARSIVTYDINVLAKYVAELKIAAVKAFNYEDFIKYMVPYFGKEKNLMFFDHKLLNALMPYLNKEVLEYWQEIIGYADKPGFLNFIDIEHPAFELSNIQAGKAFFANKMHYELLREKLKGVDNPMFIHTRFEEFDSSIGKYDIIDLSNIIECLVVEMYYTDGQLSEDSMDAIFMNIVEHLVVPQVNEAGTIIVDYRPRATIENSSDLLFRNNKYETHEIFHEDGATTDLVLTYKPKV